MAILGIDPGVSGALALLSHNGNLIEVVDMPVHVLPRSDDRILRRLEPQAVAMLLRRWRKVYEVEDAVLEHVHASPGMGVSSAFSFGHGAGVLDTVLALEGFHVTTVSPSAWKRAMRVPADKEAAMRRATALLGSSMHWPRKGHHGRAEAALLALYGHRLRHGVVEADSDLGETR